LGSALTILEEFKVYARFILSCHSLDS